MITAIIAILVGLSACSITLSVLVTIYYRRHKDYWPCMFLSATTYIPGLIAAYLLHYLQ